MTTTSRGKPPPEVPCPCGHGADEHDALAARYCRATAEGGFTRSCMCVRAVSPAGSGLIPR
ncbi:MAG TPA: RGCVC family protein [Trebonia sp.]